jgi:signal peptidase II
VVVIPGFWSFHYTANDDTGFSLLRTIGVDRLLDKTAKLAFIVTFQFIGVGIAAYFFWSPKNYLNSWVKRLPLALIISGGLGNALDRIIRGFVVDYVLWYFKDPSQFYWPIFNLADTYTVVGVAILAVFILFTKSNKAEKKIEPVVTPPDDAGKENEPKT